MYFCPKCSYVLDIVKSSNIGSNDDDKIELEKPLDAINKVKSNLDNYKPLFSKKELLDSKKYKKLSEKNKKKLESLFESNFSDAKFICNNCNYQKNIGKTILLYKINKNDSNVITSPEDNKIIFNDFTLPRTKDYSCKNPKCKTHKNKEIKEAVFYRDKNSFQLNYVCGVCYTSWKS